MHELGLMRDLIQKITQVAAAEGAAEVSRVRVWVGALAHMDRDHFLHHWKQIAADTVAADAIVEVEVDDDAMDPRAQEVVLRSIDVREPSSEN